MLDDLAAGTVDGCVVYDLDRFARQPADLEPRIKIFNERPGMSRLQPSRATSISHRPTGERWRRVMVAFANKSSMDTSRRAKRKHLELAQQGALVGTGRVFGYGDDRVTLKEIKRNSFGKRQGTSSQASRSTRLLDAGTSRNIKTPYGNIWRQAPLRQMMISPRLAGYRVHRRVDCARRRRQFGYGSAATNPRCRSLGGSIRNHPRSGRDRISMFTPGEGNGFLLASSAADAAGPR